MNILLFFAKAIYPISIYLLLLLLCHKFLDGKWRSLLLTTGLISCLLFPCVLPWTPSLWSQSPQVTSWEGPVPAIPTVVPVAPTLLPDYSRFDFKQSFYYLWAVVIVVLMTRIGIGYFYLHRYWCRDKQLASDWLQHRFADLVHEVGLKRNVRLMLTRQAVSPFIVGFYRPIVVLPQNITARLPWQQLKLILIHELSHLRRGDNLWLLLQRIVQAVYCFHPLVWWLGLALERSREIACDDSVLRYSQCRQEYACAILAILEIMNNADTRSHLLSSRFSDLKFRLQRIVNKEKIMPGKRLTTTLIFFFAFSLFIGCLFQWGGYQGGIQAQSAQSADNPQNVQIKAKLANTKLSVDFSGTPLTDALRYFSAKAKLNIVVLPEAIKEMKDCDDGVHLQVNNLSLKAILSIILGMRNLDYIISDGAILIKAKGTFLSQTSMLNSSKAATPRDKANLKKLDQNRLSIDFAEAPLSDVIDFLSTTSGIAFVIHPDVYKYNKTEALKVDLTLHKLSLRSVLNLLTTLKGLRYCLRDGVILIYYPQATSKEPTKVVKPEKDAAKTVKTSERDQANLNRLNTIKMSLNFVETPLSELIDFLRSKTGIDFVIHPNVFAGRQDKKQPKVNLIVQKLPLGNILNLLTSMYGLKYSLRDGVIIIARAQ